MCFKVSQVKDIGQGQMDFFSEANYLGSTFNFLVSFSFLSLATSYVSTIRLPYHQIHLSNVQCQGHRPRSNLKLISQLSKTSTFFAQLSYHLAQVSSIRRRCVVYMITVNVFMFKVTDQGQRENSFLDLIFTLFAHFSYNPPQQDDPGICLI